VIPDDLLKRLKNIAKSRNVSVASIINTLISEHIDENDRITLLEKRVSELEKEVRELKEKK
jgi:polyhydroxyalkanoate synthesis regulator phasin